MDSINRNQPEHNHQDIAGTTAIEKIKEIVNHADVCWFCTGVQNGHVHNGETSRPMSVRQVDDEGNLWFLSANDSFKNLEIAADPFVQLYFQGSKHSDFLQLRGRASDQTTKQKIKELWTPLAKVWFTGGIDDPRISVIKFVPTDGYYWDNKHGNMVAGMKMLIGAAIGKTLDDSIEGKVSV